MSLKSLDLIKGSCVPNMNIVISESVASDYLIVLLAEEYVADLGVCLVLRHHLSSIYVPDSYFLISSAGPCCQHIRICL